MTLFVGGYGVVVNDRRWSRSARNTARCSRKPGRPDGEMELTTIPSRTSRSPRS